MVQLEVKGRTGCALPQSDKISVQADSLTRSQGSGIGQRRGRAGQAGLKSSLLLAFLAASLMRPAFAWWADSNSVSDQAASFRNGDDGSDSDAALYKDQKRISAMNALLPISNCAECRKVRYELSATNGCYQWQNSHPQLVSMFDAHGNTLDDPSRQQGSNECTSSVYLEAKTLKETKSIILITARDSNSGTVLKCNTKVGQIDRLDIFTRSKQFSVNSNQHIAVVGYDDDDNIFSSMDGFSFDWTITEGTDIIKKFAAPDTGSRNLHHTDYFFIRSLKPGFATVSVKLEEPGYETVKLVKKRLTVVDPFIILPAEPVYILPTSEFQFSLAHLDMDGWQRKLIQIPDAQFKWSSGSPAIGTVSDEGKFRSKLSEGEATIFVVDQQMKNNTAEGFINVVHPYRMEVSIRDITELDQLKKLHAGDDAEFIQAWLEGLDKIDGRAGDQEQELGDTHIMIEEHYYRIKMHLYDKNGHKITLTENLRFKSLNMGATWIDIIKVNAIGSEMVIKTKKIQDDTVKIQSQHKLDEIVPVPRTAEKFTSFASRLTQDKELIITKPVKIQHPTNLVLLPFLPNAQETHGSGEVWNLSSKGGSGIYMWSIVDTSVASVQGSAQIRSLAIGKTKLICRDHKNQNNWDSIEVEVAQISQLMWLEQQLEIKTRPVVVPQSDQSQTQGESRVISLYALDSKGRKFTNCTSVRPSYEVRGETFINVAQESSDKRLPKYAQIKGYVSSERNWDLLSLQQRFEEQPDVTISSSLSDQMKLEKGLLMHNNFGICAQKEVIGEKEGLARLRASFMVHEYLNGPSRLVESEFTEIAVYNPLRSVEPTYAPYMRDLYSQSQLGQEFQSFESFYDDWKLKLQFGTSLEWRVFGGSNFWPDQDQNYETSWSSQALTKDSKEASFDVKTIAVSTSESRFGLRCQAPEGGSQSQRAKITLRQASRSTRSLLRPAVHETKVELHCEPPKSLKLLWAQDFKPAVNETSRALKQLPRSRIVHNERTHFVLVNSKHSLRYLVLDDGSQVSFNSSSVLTNVDVSDDTMATILMAGQPTDRSYSEDVLSGLYDKRAVQFKNITGKVYIKAEATHYLDDFTGGRSGQKDGLWSFGGGSKGEKARNLMKVVYQSSINGNAHSLGSVTDHMAIEVVRNVDVEPKFKSLYIGTQQQTYKLKILHGSGAFAVTVNNTRLVDIVQKDREILLTPKELGGLKIMVEDLELPHSQIATAELLISDIAKLTLWAPLTLIEKGDEMVMTVSAYDSNMQMFDADQYALMHFNIETETISLSRTRGLLSSQVPGQVRDFLAYGQEPGVYQLTAFTFAFSNPNNSQGDLNYKAKTIVSELLRIEVFPILEIYPSNLLITPNMRYTLQIVGGPQSTAKSQQQDGSHIEINFAIENTQVATIDRFREVTGHEVGDAVLKYELIQLRTQNNIQPQPNQDQSGKGVLAPVQPQSRVVSKKTIKIRVRLVTEIEIPFTHQRQIYAGSLIKMMGVLKHGDELFHHGVAPISYNWNVAESRVLDLDLPTKQELAQVHGIATNLVMTSRYIRDNLANRELNFFTAFNSSSIYARGDQEGETFVTCQLAIEYPEKYRHDQNWFTASVNVKVMDRLTIQVPQYSIESEKETHMYLVPPQTTTKIETNKQTKLKLGYSQQSVFDYSTNSYRYEESKSPIISLVNDEAIRTFDKYGKVTLLVEEGGAFSDQMVMLNVKVADVFTLATMRSYDALSLPLGSRLTLPIHLQDDRAHKFAEKISGVNVGFYLSHPKVVHVNLNAYNETMTVQSLGSGDCNIFIFLEDRPHVFDVVRVRVSGVVQPASPVYIHMGGEINFRVESTDGMSKDSNDAQVIWSSSNPSVLQIDGSSGRATGLREGKADVLLSNHMNAASIVHVSKIANAQLDQKSQLTIRTDEGSLGSTPEYRVRIRLFLDKQPDETMPTVQFDGITLIRQHVSISCESDNTDYVQARGEVNDLEGFFCVMNYVRGADSRAMPKFVKITASVSGRDPEGKIVYTEKVIDFEMQLQSEISVETKFGKEIKLCNDHRMETIRVYSSSDVKVSFDYGTPEDEGQLVLHQVTPVSKTTNEYSLTVQVPVQVSHSFDVIMTLSHQFAHKEKRVLLSFHADENCDSNKSILEQAGDYFSSGQEAQQQQKQSSPPPLSSADESLAGFWISYIIFFSAFIFVILYVLTQFCEVDLMYHWDRQCGRGKRVSSSNQHRYQQSYNRYQTNLSGTGDGIRDSRAFKRQPLARDSTFSSFGRDMHGSSVSMKRAQGRQQTMQDGARMHLDDFNMRQNRQQTQNASASRGSRFDSMQDSHRYY